MTTRKDKQREPEPSPKEKKTHDSGGHDHRIIGLVRLLARKAAQRDYEKLLEKTNIDEFTENSKPRLD